MGTCFGARCLEVVAVAGLLWISWCALGPAGFHAFFPFSFFLKLTRTAASMRPPCLIGITTSTGVCTGFHYLCSLSAGLSVCLFVCVLLYLCVTLVVFTDCESCTRPISSTPGSTETGEHWLTCGGCFVAAGEVFGVTALLWISWCVLGAAGFRV